MGRRLALLDALTRAPDGLLPEPPRVIVAPVRALLQRIGPLEGAAPLHIRPGAAGRRSAILLPELVARGYRREHQVEHRGEFAVRGGIVDVFPSTADEPVRVDLWGDEVDRLTAFSVSDQRSSRDLEAVVLYGCRELVMTRRAPCRGVGAHGHAALGARRCGSAWPTASSSTAWSRGFRFSTTRPGSCRTCCPPARRWCWSSRAASETAAHSSSTRKRRWRRRSRPPGARREGEARTRSRACTCRSNGSCATARPVSRPCRPCRRDPPSPHSRCGGSTRWPVTRPGWRPA